jgi:hypothetical protein
MAMTNDAKMVKARGQAEQRVSRVLKDLRLLGKLARYEFSEPEVTQIFAAVRNELDVTESQFAPREKPPQAAFKFG